MNEIIKLNNTRYRLQIIETGKRDRRIPSKFLKPEWVRIEEEELFIKIFGHRVEEAARDIGDWLVVVHVTDPYFRQSGAFEALHKQLVKEFEKEFKDLMFNGGLNAEQLKHQSVYELAHTLHMKYDIDVKIDPMKITYEAKKRAKLSVEEYESYFADQLKEECKFFKLAVSGTKQELIKRLTK